MKTFILSLATVAGLMAHLAGAQLTNMVPPPPCLYQCLEPYLGTPEASSICASDSKIPTCCASGCSYRDISYANVYYNGICSSGSFVEFTPNGTTTITVPLPSATS
ncbi:hypothetical protein L228DRAFT_244223 [Xylona heveae TC161]|uniref:Extracellular membrane protein CFEM domain-containing protein n=1 Tax=Xylona heveae (strain CBS 132557 / TC161) TaxID=1328760 RepID=A0A165IU53_XYLHT|nr:hypothetical protein L228DRAFT_244223 [Xylona heveae TC161]KZF25394.1 hypothetical protein L228DRAFT_244223 [Xylona heveae TC161]